MDRRGSSLDYDLLEVPAGTSPFSSSSHHDHIIFTIANRILFAKYYYLVYIVLFIAQSILLIWGLYHHSLFSKITNDDAWYVALDILITLLLALEVIFRIIATHRTYWRSWLNRADFILMLVCVCALLLYAVDPQAAIIGSMFVAIRYAVQILRVCITCKHHRDRRHMISAMNGRIAFDAVEASGSHGVKSSGGGGSLAGSLLSSPLIDSGHSDAYATGHDAALALRDLVPVRSINSRIIRVTDDDREHAHLLSMYEEQAQLREQANRTAAGQEVQGQGAKPEHAPAQGDTDQAPLPYQAHHLTGTNGVGVGVGSPSPSPPVVDDRTVPLAALTHLPSHASLISHSFYQMHHMDQHHDEDDGL